MNPTYDFTGQTAFVTGAASGMGLATARAFARSGATVALADINEAAAKEASEALVADGFDTIGLGCDVSDEDNVAATVGQVVRKYGRLDMGVQQRRHSGAAERRRGRAGRDVRSSQRHQPARGVGMYET